MPSNFNNENENSFSSISKSIGAFNLIWITLFNFELELLANNFAFINNCTEKLRVLILIVETVVDVVSQKHIHSNIWLEG